MSLSFIKTDIKQWDLSENFDNGDRIDNTLVGIPGYDRPIPVIASIGSSRDGKSTLLNILHKYYIKMVGEKIDILNTYPFKSKNGDMMVTNGIDFLHIHDRCILVDCQGMALKDAKYDHYLTLVVYLISDIIILNVRQRLDLQVLNNLLAVFSFISEIPVENRRRDKPTLIIRVKDFQDFELLENDPHYLKNCVKKWMEKSGDQYDQIKDAFEMAFDIDIVYTEYPKFPPRKSTLDIYHTDFEIDNPSFVNACSHMMRITDSRTLIENKLLTDPANMRELVRSLRANQTIDYRKLDLYHNLTTVELERYVNTDVNIYPYNDTGIIDQMNGSRESYIKYISRMEIINKLEIYIYDTKFKDITAELKTGIFLNWIAKFKSIVGVCEEKNRKFAQKIINPHLDLFKNKFDFETTQFERLVTGILDIFNDAHIVLAHKLELIDFKLASDILQDLNEEKNKLTEIQKEINVLNQSNIHELNEAVRTYDHIGQYKKYTIESINIDMKNQNYNYDSNITYMWVQRKLKEDLRKIHSTYNKIRYIKHNQQIGVSHTLPYSLDTHIPEEDSIFYWSSKAKILTDMIFVSVPCSYDFSRPVSGPGPRSAQVPQNHIDIVRLHYTDREYIAFTIVAFMAFIKHQTVTKYFEDYGHLYTNSDKIPNIIQTVTGAFNSSSVSEYESEQYFQIIRVNPEYIDIWVKFNENWKVPQEMVDIVKLDLFRAVNIYIRDHVPNTSNIEFRINTKKTTKSKMIIYEDARDNVIYEDAVDADEDNKYDENLQYTVKASSKIKSKVSVPAKSKVHVPAKSKETTPAKRKETVPAKSKETVPAKSKETVPAKSKETVPAKSKETVPAKSKETVPDNEPYEPWYKRVCRRINGPTDNESDEKIKKEYNYTYYRKEGAIEFAVLLNGAPNIMIRDCDRGLCRVIYEYDRDVRALYKSKLSTASFSLNNNDAIDQIKELVLKFLNNNDAID